MEKSEREDQGQSPADQEAVDAALFEQYCSRLRALVHREMGWSLRRVEASSDIIQSAFLSFFRYLNKQPPAVKSAHDLWPLLVTIAINKIRNRSKFWQRQRRDLRRKTSFADFAVLLDHGDSPSEVAALKEILDQLLQAFSARRRRILEMVIQGYELNEIASQVGTTARTVYNTRLAAFQVLEALLHSQE